MNLQLQRLLSDTFVMYAHAHIGHWNVVGPDFHDKHAFLGDLYEELWGAVDAIAEHIRAIGEMAPRSLEDICDAGLLDEDEVVGSSWSEIRPLLAADNLVVMEDINAAIRNTTDQGLIDFLAGRLDVHAKHGWMLEASK